VWKLAEYEKGQHPNSRANLLPKPPQWATRKGAYASMKAKKKQKQIRDIVGYLLELPVSGGKVEKLRNILEAKTKNLTVIETITVAQIKKAVSGDTRAFEALIDVAYNRNYQQIEDEAKGGQTAIANFINGVCENQTQNNDIDTLGTASEDLDQTIDSEVPE
jgi:hypothetical protein